MGGLQALWVATARLALAMLCCFSCFDTSASSDGYGAGAGVAAAPASFPGRRLVTAHWMVGGVPVDYAAHIAKAQAAGIDAFALNYGGWNLETYRSAWLSSISAIFKAAEGTTFKLFFSFDMTSVGRDDVLSLSRQWGNHANFLWYEGKMFVSTFEKGNLDWPNEILTPLANEGLPVYFMPMFSQFSCPDLGAYPYAQGLYKWIDPSSFANDQAVDRQYAALKPQRAWMAGVAPWFYAHYASKNWGNPLDSSLFVDKFQSLLTLDPDAIQLVTWNDFGESSYFGPAEGVLDDQWWSHLNHDALLELASYFIAAYKAGSAPAVTTEKVFYFYRPHALRAVASNDPLGVPSDAGGMADDIVAVALVAAPAQVVITSGGASQTFDVPAGLTKLRMPFAEGAQSVALRRNGTVVAADTNAVPISNQITRYNLNIVAGVARSGETLAAPVVAPTPPAVAITATTPAAAPAAASTTVGAAPAVVPEAATTKAATPLAATTAAAQTATTARNTFTSRTPVRTTTVAADAATTTAATPPNASATAATTTDPAAPSASETATAFARTFQLEMGCPAAPLAAAKRTDCLWGTQSACEADHCCWAPLTPKSAEPWCYYPIRV